METLQSFWPVAAGLVAIYVAFLVARLRSRRAESFPYFCRDSLMTQTELRFYKILQSVVAGRWDVFAMVRVADLLRVRAGTAQRQSWQNRILAKHVDFVVCDGDTLEPLLAIELDDNSHDRPDRIERDAFLDQALEAAELPLLRVRVTRTYDARQLRRSIDEKILGTRRKRA